MTLLEQIAAMKQQDTVGRAQALYDRQRVLAKLREVVEQAQHLRNAVTFKTPPVKFGAGNLCYEARVPVGFVKHLETALTPMPED